MPERVTDIEAHIRQMVAPGYHENLLDRGLARGLIWRNGIMPPGAPTFAADLTEYLLDFAYSVLSISLRLRKEVRHSSLLAEAFLKAGEAIEAAVHRGNPERQDRGFHRVNAAVAFHLARYSARAYSILPSGPASANLSPTEGSVADLMRRSLENLHNRYSSWLLNDSHKDDSIANRLGTDQDFDEFDALNDILTSSFMRGLALLDHAILAGYAPSYEAAKRNLQNCIASASDFNMVSQWWNFTLSLHLFDELWENCLHRSLPTLPADHRDARWNILRTLYIHRLRSDQRAAIELWPSQVEAAKRAIDPTDNLVVALPTSAGKTRVAELCILRALAADKRVVYVTPLRALSAQVERNLNEIFRPLGFPVSSLYGAAGIEVSDSVTLRTYRIVVATPEKLDFALRNDSSIIDDVGLIVLDEGHMLGPGEREVRYEALVERLLHRSDAGERRLVCLSALFPEPEKMSDLVAWLRRDMPGQPIYSTWRPTRQRFGWISWEGFSARLEVQVEGEQPFIPQFVTSSSPPVGSRRQNDFPHNKNELTLASAWQFAMQDKDVLIYCALRVSVETLGRLVLQLMSQGVLRPLGEIAPEVREVILSGSEWLGEEHPAILCLGYGVVLHHAGLPKQYLNEVEKLLRAGYCHITIASPTLAQGLNISASVLLVPSIWRNKKIIPPMELANVAGRAGRAYVDLEGLVLNIIWPENRLQERKEIRRWTHLRAQAKMATIQSGLLQLARRFFGRIARAAGIPEEEVLNYVTGSAEAWDCSETEGAQAAVKVADWENDITSLDAAILALLDIETAIADIERRLEEVLLGSLFSRQLSHEEVNIQALIKKFLALRANFIWSCTSQAQRKGYYAAGVGLRSGQYLDQHLGELVERLVCIETALEENNENEVNEAAVAFARIVFETHPFRPPKLPETWKEALQAWLSGKPTAAVIRISGDDGVDFIQDAIIYRLAWAMEAVRVHAAAVAHPGVDRLQGIAAMPIVSGSANRAVITLLRAGLTSRETAVAAVRSTGATFTNKLEMEEWLRLEDVHENSRRDDWPSASGRPAWLRFIDALTLDDRAQWTLLKQVVRVEWLRSESPPNPNDYVIIEPTETDGGLVLSTDYTSLGHFQDSLRRPRSQILEARVGESPATIQISYFGSRSRP